MRAASSLSERTGRSRDRNLAFHGGSVYNGVVRDSNREVMPEAAVREERLASKECLFENLHGGRTWRNS